MADLFYQWQPADIWEMYRDRKEWQRMDDIFIELSNMWRDLIEEDTGCGECKCKRA